MRTNTMTNNVAMLTAVENRLNHDENGNLVLFPVTFEESKEIFSEVDAVNREIFRLVSRRDELSRKGDAVMMQEYKKKEYYRLAHEFLKEMYIDDDLEIHSIFDNVKDRLRYKNSKVIKDHKGRLFPTIKDACEYNHVKPERFYARRRAGLSLEECFSSTPLKRGKKARKDVMK